MAWCSANSSTSSGCFSCSSFATARCCAPLPVGAVVSAAANICLWWLAGNGRTSAMMMGHHLLDPLSFSPSPKLAVLFYAIVSEIRCVRTMSRLVASASTLPCSSCFIHVVLVGLQLALKNSPVANSCNRDLLSFASPSEGAEKHRGSSSRGCAGF